VKLHRERPLLDQLELREMFEQRVRRRRGDDVVSGIGEELEEKRIRLAGRRRDQELAGIAAEMRRQRLARAPQTARIRVVFRVCGARERLADLVERVGDACARRIRFRQVQRVRMACARDREPVRRRVPLRASREHQSLELSA